jgi:hypothetical protein
MLLRAVLDTWHSRLKGRAPVEATSASPRLGNSSRGSTKNGVLSKTAQNGPDLCRYIFFVGYCERARLRVVYSNGVRVDNAIGPCLEKCRSHIEMVQATISKKDK